MQGRALQAAWLALGGARHKFFVAWGEPPGPRGAPLQELARLYGWILCQRCGFPRRPALPSEHGQLFFGFCLECHHSPL